MRDYDLAGLSARSFEKLIQSIAGKVLGPGTVTFGDGPDGGREATFLGRMDYPSQAAPWDGYCVIQAKFLQRPKDPSADGRWAFKQLEAELKAFADPKKERRRPDYYIFATNVVLTPVQDRGGKDRAAALFAKYQKKVPLRGWAIWDFDENRRFLDSFADVRKGYAAWITPGDVLSEVMQQFASRRPDFLEVMTNFLAKELRSDQFANLEQAGHSTEERIPLARVFVDLPVGTQRITEPPPEEEKQESEIAELITTLMENAKDPLDPASVQQKQLSPEGRPPHPHAPQPGRYVLVGGPGQGKTTVGQFACQLFRLSLLLDRPHHLLPPEVNEPLSALLEQCRASIPLGLPRTRRFPVRVTLSEFATALNADRELSLLAFIARQIERRTGRTVSPDDLRGWLSTYPWFLVLDGLDEVPASTNREDVLKKVEDFWIDAAQVNADVLVLATTRPQGYSDDFSPAYYRHLWLAPLSPRRAMAYARRLVEVRYAGEPDRQQKLLSRLQLASKQEATARLMRSPLQITIMAALVDQTGTPPQDRWRLFHDYYEVIYNRERERPIPAAELLREYKPNIDAIHHLVGLVLQVESERAGGAEAKLPADRFAALVTARLEEEGFSGQALHRLKDRIIDAAANRLVFLVGLEAGQVGFEIRSLQESMAAEAIMTGSQDKIQERLRRFAPIASWRNVFLFAAGRCFLQEQHLRDTIHTVCIELDDQLAGPVGRATLAGSALALDLLEDGVAHRQPKYARLLAQCAARLLELPPTDMHARLADVCEGEVETVVRENVENTLAVQGPGTLAAWATLLPLAGRGLRWASELADRSWPSDASEQLNLLSLPSADRAMSWVGDRVLTVIKHNPAHKVWHIIRRTSGREARRGSPHFYDAPFWIHHRGEVDVRIVLSGLSLTVTLTPIAQARQYASEVNLDVGDVHPEWVPTIEDIRFSRSPSKQALAAGLSRIAAANKTFEPDFYQPPLLSWVFAACLAAGRSSAELNTLAERAAKGDLGDLSDWLTAEGRWKKQGVTLEDLLLLTGDRWPFDREIAQRGFPIGAAREISWSKRATVSAIEDFVARLSQVPIVERTMAPWFIFPPYPGQALIPPHLWARLLRLVENEFIPCDVAFLHAALHRDAAWLDVLDELGRTKTVYFPGPFEEATATLQLLVLLFEHYPDRAGLLPLIVAGLTDRPFMPGMKLDRLNPPHVRFEQYDNPRIRWAAVVLELIQEGLHRDRARELAAITATLRSLRAHTLQEAVTAISRYERFDEPTDYYLLELRRQLSDASWGEQLYIVNALNGSLRRRSSGVAELRVWRSLALPEKVLDIVTSPRA